MTDDGPTVTFDGGAAEDIANAFGWSVDDDGWVVDEDGERVESFNGHELTIDEFAGAVDGRERDVVPLRANFSDVGEYVAWKRQNGQEQENDTQ